LRKFKQQAVTQGKIAKTHRTNGASTEQLSPIFSFRYLQRSTPYCISCCSNDEKASFADKMNKLSQLTWADIKRAPRHGLGCEKIDRNSIRATIPERVTDDTAILAFRFHGKAPMVGFRDRETFHVLWFDANFSLYQHN